MLSTIVVFAVILSIFYFFLAQGSFDALTNSILSSGNDAINLVITLTGAMALWGGIIKIAEDSGIIKKLTEILMPILRRLFKGLHKNSRALEAISVNVISNILGLGNAATPSGIKAMQLLEKEENASEYATKNMIKFVLLNTASIQLIPTTILAIRISHGSQAPSQIIPCIIIVSILSLTASLLTSYIFELISKRKR